MGLRRTYMGAVEEEVGGKGLQEWTAFLNSIYPI